MPLRWAILSSINKVFPLPIMFSNQRSSASLTAGCNEEGASVIIKMPQVAVQLNSG